MRGKLTSSYFQSLVFVHTNSHTHTHTHTNTFSHSLALKHPLLQDASDFEPDEDDGEDDLRTLEEEEFIARACRESDPDEVAELQKASL